MTFAVLNWRVAQHSGELSLLPKNLHKGLGFCTDLPQPSGQTVVCSANKLTRAVEVHTMKIDSWRGNASVRVNASDPDPYADALRSRGRYQRALMVTTWLC
jgi:hypothetical protein